MLWNGKHISDNKRVKSHLRIRNSWCWTNEPIPPCCTLMSHTLFLSTSLASKAIAEIKAPFNPWTLEMTEPDWVVFNFNDILMSLKHLFACDSLRENSEEEAYILSQGFRKVSLHLQQQQWLCSWQWESMAELIYKAGWSLRCAWPPKPALMSNSPTSSRLCSLHTRATGCGEQIRINPEKKPYIPIENIWW